MYFYGKNFGSLVRLPKNCYFFETNSPDTLSKHVFFLYNFRSRSFVAFEKKKKENKNEY